MHLAAFYCRLNFGIAIPRPGPTILGLSMACGKHPSVILMPGDNMICRPDNCDGTYEQYCDPNRQYTNVSAIIAAAGKTELLTYMNKYWKDYQGDDEDFWEHEWDKHGTCISTLEPGCYDKYTPQQEVVAYFQKTVDLFKTLDSYAFLAAKGITPSSTTTYKSENIQKALAEPRGVQVTIRCSKGELNEVWYFYNVRGSVETGSFVPAEPGKNPFKSFTVAVIDLFQMEPNPTVRPT